jgi:hypothetical protein
MTLVKFGYFEYTIVIPELPELNSVFVSCYPKFLNKIRVSGIPSLVFGLRVFLSNPSIPCASSIPAVVDSD